LLKKCVILTGLGSVLVTNMDPVPDCKKNPGSGSVKNESGCEHCMIPRQKDSNTNIINPSSHGVPHHPLLQTGTVFPVIEELHVS